MNEIVTRREKRVCFDFEVDFSNGGGLQGQGFRLDIQGEDIADDDLAAYIIRDLRLLMVGEVRILNKQVIEERHKRSITSTEASADAGNEGRFVDLSHTIEEGLITLKGYPTPLVCDFLSREESRKIYAEGTEFHVGRIDMVSNTGTYIDTPFHRYADGHDLTELDLARVSNAPGVVARVLGLEGRAVDWTHFVPIDCKGAAVLVNTGWDRHWGTESYFEDFPFLTERAAEYLRDQGALLVGIDSLNIDNTSGKTRPVHSILLGAGIPIVEHLTGLGALPSTGFTFSAAPPKIRGLGTFPVRAHARIATPPS